MVWDDFISGFDGALKEKNLPKAHRVMMVELGRIILLNRQDVIDLLNESGLPASADMSNAQIIDIYSSNIHKNPQLMLGTSILLNTYNSKNSGFDGNKDLNVKNGYAVLREYFSAADGALGTVAGAVSSLGSSAAQIVSGAQQNKAKKLYGATDLASQKEATKQALIQSVMAGQQAASDAAMKEQEQKKKTTTYLIIGGVLVTVGIIAFLALKKR